MILNDKKGWFGSFSAAGKGSAQKYNAFTKKNRRKKAKIYNPFDHHNLKEKAGDIEDNVDIFRINTLEIKSEIKSDQNKKNDKRLLSSFPTSKTRHGLQEDKLFYHNKHIKEGTVIKKQYPPPCTKYNPRFNIILKRSASAPEWKTLTYRRDNFTKKINSKIYINQPNIINNKAGKSFVDMAKQTNRNVSEGFFVARSRPQTTKAKRSESSKTNSTVKSLKKTPSFSKKVTRPSTANIGPRLSRKGSFFRKSIYRKLSSPENENENEVITTQSAEDSYDEYMNIYMKQFKKKNNSFQVQKEEQKEPIKGIDFKKVISREHLDKIEDKKKGVIPFSLPIFKQVRERPIMMVVYDRIKYKNTKTKPFKGIDQSINYDPDKIINKVNNHSIAKPPDFNLMTSRPDDVDPLPAYMKQIYSRSSCYETTSLSLKMNNYANGTFLNPSTSFWPKKSYNKILNLNLLHSNKFLADAIGNKNVFIKKNHSIGKALRFYDKNFNDLLKDELLSKFDGITYKTNKRHNSIDVQDVEKYLLNYD